MHTAKNIFLTIALAITALATAHSQEKIVNPEISYSSQVKEYSIAKLSVSGVDEYEDFTLTGISGLSVGQTISVPGTEITDAVKRYWKHGFFSDVRIAADSIVADSIYLHIYLKTRPRVSDINYIGLKKKSEREDMEQKLGLLKGSQITPNMISRAKVLAQRYFQDKGFKNAEVNILQHDDVTEKNHIILDVIIDKKEKTKVRRITIEGNKDISMSDLKGSLFTKGALKDINEAGKLRSFIKKKKNTP